MKKISILVLAAALVLVPSCKNNNKANKTQQTGIDYGEATIDQLTSEELKADMAMLIESAKKIKMVPFAKANSEGKIVLTEKEKMVKPDFLISPDAAKGLVTLSQKYRAIGMLTSDKSIAELYSMSVADYNKNIFKLLTDINDPALTDFYTLPSLDIESNREAFSIFVDEEYEAGRINYFWEGVSAGMVEQIYILTRDVDKFMPMFTDGLASEITFNFVCLHDGLTKTVNASPEMESLNEILEPLYVINAITVEELRSQLVSVKGDIEVAREKLLK